SRIDKRRAGTRGLAACGTERLQEVTTTKTRKIITFTHNGSFRNSSAHWQKKRADGGNSCTWIYHWDCIPMVMTFGAIVNSLSRTCPEARLRTLCSREDRTGAFHQ